MLDLLTRQPRSLIATGGGAVLDAETRERLRSRGCVVYLRTSVDQQLARTRRSTHRPLLDTPDPRGTLQRLMQQRAGLYEESADLTVDTDGRKVKTVVDEIVRQGYEYAAGVIDALPPAQQAAFGLAHGSERKETADAQPR